jgi:hypothetical protein
MPANLECMNILFATSHPEVYEGPCVCPLPLYLLAVAGSKDIHPPNQLGRGIGRTKPLLFQVYSICTLLLCQSLFLLYTLANEQTLQHVMQLAAGQEHPHARVCRRGYAPPPLNCNTPPPKQPLCGTQNNT